MTEQELGIAKKIAEIEGVEIQCDRDDSGNLTSVYEPADDNGWCNVYNPFCWSMLGQLLVKYKVTVNLVGSYYCTQIAHNGIGTCEDNSLGYSPSLPSAILECIIKSQEK